MSNSSQLCPTDFSREGQKGLQGKLLPFPCGFWPVSNSFKVCPRHFYRRTENFLASYRPGFAPSCCVNRLATAEALKTNVHLLLLWLTLQTSAIVCECLRKRHNWSVSIRFNSQLRVWVTGSQAMRRGPAGTLFWGPTATEGLETKGQARNQLETPRGWRVFWEAHNFFLGGLCPLLSPYLWAC